MKRIHCVYAYCRVGTRDQNLDCQLCVMRVFGVPDSRIFLEKLSGKDFDRPDWSRLMRKLRSGDTLVVKSIDRLGRNYEEILGQWRIFTKEKQADIVVLNMTLLDTRMGTRTLVKEKPDNYPAVCMLWQNREISSRKAARLGVSHKTLLKWVRETADGESA